MADSDTGLIARLEARIDKFEKSMKDASNVADKTMSTIERRFSDANMVVSSKLDAMASTASSRLGTAGALLGALGPAGVVAAAGIGAVVGTMYSLAEATAQFAEKSKVLREASETAGLTISQFKLLGSAGKTVGLDFDETSAFFTKYIANIEALRNGGGPLYDALLKIDTGLLRQLASTKDSAEAIDILIKAYGRLDNQTSRLNLARAAGGRAGLSGGRLLEALGNSGGMAAINEKAFTDPAKNFDDLTKRAALLKDEIAAIQAKTNTIWGSMFADKFLQSSKTMAEDFQKIAEAVQRIANGNPGALADLGAGFDAMGNPTGAGSTSESPRTRVYIHGGATEPPPPLPQPRPNTAPVPASVELALLQRQIGLLGEAVTQAEQWRLKRLEIAAAAEKGGISDQVAQRALAAFDVTMRAAALGARERLGVATEEATVSVRLAQLQQDRIKYGLSENEVIAAGIIIRREAKQAAEQLQVRQSELPGLKQYQLDAANLKKGLDQVGVNSLNTITDDLTALVTSTKSAKEAFSDMAKSILNDLVKLSIRQAITGPLSGILGTLFGGGGGLSSIGIGIGRNAAGTDSWRGGPTWVGERGPEIVNLPRGAQVVPNDVARRGGGGGSTYAPVYQIDARGADAGAVDRIQMVLAAHSRTLKGMNDAASNQWRFT